MDDMNRMIGALEEFKRAQIEANNLNRQEHREMMEEILTVNKWRWKIDGVRIVIATICGIAGGAFAKVVFMRIMGS